MSFPLPSCAICCRYQDFCIDSEGRRKGVWTGDESQGMLYTVGGIGTNGLIFPFAVWRIVGWSGSGMGVLLFEVGGRIGLIS